jgi:hypothetical protein
MVEMCPLAIGLILAPAQLWTPLSPHERKNVSAWLGSINTKKMPDTNWLWFRVFANLGLLAQGGENGGDAAQVQRDMDHLETFYRGDGWSNDGPEGYTQMDYYSGSFAIQLLQLVYVRVWGHRDPQRAERYRGWAREFAGAFVRYFDEEGNVYVPFSFFFWFGLVDEEALCSRYVRLTGLADGMQVGRSHSGAR